MEQHRKENRYKEDGKEQECKGKGINKDGNPTKEKIWKISTVPRKN